MPMRDCDFSSVAPEPEPVTAFRPGPMSRAVPSPRRRWRRPAFAVASALMLGLAVGACGGGDSGSSNDTGASNKSSGGTDAGQAPFTTTPKAEVASLNAAYSDKLQNLDPIVAGNTTDIVIVNLLNGNLFAFPLSGTGEVEPSLAESGEFGPDNKSFEVKLKDGLTFSDGKPLTAEDVVATIERAKKSKTTIFAAHYAPISKVTAVDDTTVKFEFSRAYPSFKVLLAYPNFGILESSQIGKDGSIPKVPVGAGQYVADGSPFGNKFTLKRNDRYGAGPKPAAAQLVFTVESDPTARLQQLASGQFDFAYDLHATALKNPPCDGAASVPADRRLQLHGDEQQGDAAEQHGGPQGDLAGHRPRQGLADCVAGPREADRWLLPQRVRLGVEARCRLPMSPPRRSSWPAPPVPAAARSSCWSLPASPGRPRPA